MAAPRVTIDTLPEKVTLAGTEWFMVQDGTTSKKVSASKVATTRMAAETTETDDALAAVIEVLGVLTDQTDATLNANPAAFIKELARECQTIARQARLTSG